MAAASIIPRVDASFVRRFPRDEAVRRKQFEFEDAFKPYIDAPTAPFPGVAAPPSVDRPLFIMGDGKRVLLVTSATVQLTLDFGQVLPKSGIKSALERAASYMARCQDILPDQGQFYEGLILSVAYACPEDGALLSSIFHRIFGREKPDEFSTGNAILGFAGEKFNRQIEFQLARQTDVAMKTVDGQVMPESDPEFSETTWRHSLIFKYDVNSKPTIGNQSGSLYDEIVPEIGKLIRFGSEYFGPEISDDIIKKAGL